MPVLSPTVANAEMHSKSTRSRPRDSSASMMSMVPPITAPVARTTTVMASRCTERESCLPSTGTAAPPRISVRAMKKSTPNVVTFRPPAVPAGPPPMNMRMSSPSQDTGCMWEMSMLLNPAVRAIVDWKNALSTFTAGDSCPRVCELFHSSTARNTVPPSSSTGVASSTRRVFMLQRRGVRMWRRSS